MIPNCGKQSVKHDCFPDQQEWQKHGVNGVNGVIERSDHARKVRFMVKKRHHGVTPSFHMKQFCLYRTQNLRVESKLQFCDNLEKTFFVDCCYELTQTQ
jgi:hypothetical protein